MNCHNSSGVYSLYGQWQTAQILFGGKEVMNLKHLPSVGMEHLIPLAHYLTLINLSHCQSKQSRYTSFVYYHFCKLQLQS